MEEEEENILYELLINEEWPLEPDIIGNESLSQGGSILYRTLKRTPSSIWSLASYAAKSFWSQNSVSADLSRFISFSSEWQLGIGAQGAVIAVLQKASLEIRAKKDGYASVVGKNFNLYADPFPSWRKISWSAECSMVAVAYSNGAVEIFNTLGASLFTIYPPRFKENIPQVDTNNALAALIFSDIRTQKIKWVAELIMVDFFGNIRGYYVSPTEGYQESHYFSLYSLYPTGITAAVNIGSLMIVAGVCQFLNDKNLRNNGLGHGLSIWRMINDYPYYKQVPTIDEDEYTPPNASFLRRIFGLQADPVYDCIFRLSASPLGRQVATIHTSGSISIWDVPSLRKRKFWSLETQPGYHLEKPTFSPSAVAQKHRVGPYPSDGIRHHIADIKWWSESAVILSRFSGAVTICSTNSLLNLLGMSPEFFEGVPQISEAYDRSFLGLEIERQIVKSNQRSFANISESSEREELPDETQFIEEDVDLTFVQKSKLLFNRAMFWITDAERFRPSDRKSKLVSSTGRLLCLKSTTPAELFSRKIEDEEYGEALALAQRYNLDCDLVYHQQWRKKPVTVTSIQDYLSKIKKRSSVLDECLTRVPEDIDAARELILYGLRGTELDTLVAIGESKNCDEFIVSDLVEFEEDFDLDPAEAERQAQEWAANDLKMRRELLSHINFLDLNEEQIKVIRARQKLLTFYDRLGTYEILLGGPNMAAERYDPKFYEKFRNQSEIEASIEFARNYNWRGVDIMFTYHGDVTLPHRLAVLSSFPPMMGPYEYRTILPECDLSGQVFEWDEDSLRDADWCEDEICRRVVPMQEDSAAKTLYGTSPELAKFLDMEVTSDVLCDWYQLRARDIEKSSHFVDAALDLLKLGRERNVLGLEDLQSTFDTLEVLIYEVGLESLSLEKFETLDDLEKLKLLMSTSSLETYIQNLRRWGLPFLSHCEKKNPGSTKKLLRDFLVCSAKEDLAIALKTFKHSQADQPDTIISDTEDLLCAALDCIYTCKAETQLPKAFAILECLPVKKASDSKELSSIHELVDDLEDHLGAAELLSTHGILVSPLFVKNIQRDETQIKLLLTRLSRTAARRETKMSYESWNKLLSDVLELQQKVFTVVDPQTCFEIVTDALLTSGNLGYINYAKELMDTRVDGSPIHNPYLQQLPYPVAVKLVINASMEYFNSAESYADTEMDLARRCLNLIESDNEDINRELDLISSLEILPDIGIHRLPLQVRLCENRLSLIEEALKRHPDNHLHGSRILRLADMLRVCGDDHRLRTAKVLSLIAVAAFEAGDFVSCSTWCSLLVRGGHSEGWEICACLGRCPRISDLNHRAELLNFALTHASDAHLEDLLTARSEVELSLLYEKLNEGINASVSLDSDDGFEDARADSEEEMSEDEWSDPRTDLPTVTSTPSTKRLLDLPFDVTRNMISATASTTSSIVSNVANRKLWKNAVGWLRPLRGRYLQTLKQDFEKSGSNNGFEKQGFHAFYADLCPDAHISSLGITYNSYTPPMYNPALDVSLTLLRIALIEETLSQGNTCQTNTSVLQDLARRVLQEDLMLGLSLLLLLSSKDAQDVLVSIPRTEVSLQISRYYYAIQIYTCLHPWEEPGIAPVFLHSPAAVVSCIRTTIARDLISSDERAAIQFFIDQFLNIEKVIGDYVQGQSLRRLGAGVNIERFLSDSEYKKDSMLGLAMSANPDMLTLAVDLAKKYEVPVWEVYMAHLTFLFDTEIDTADLEEIIRARNLLELLKEKPEDFVTSMERNVAFTIDGKDHKRLGLYYDLILVVTQDNELTKSCRSHLQILAELGKLGTVVNYKSLLAPSSDILDILKPILTSENVNVLAGVAEKLPRGEAEPIHPSLVYCAWAQKHFFDTTSKKKPKAPSEWVKRYDETEDILHLMRASDVSRLIESFLFSPDATLMLPLEARKEIIKKATKYCHSRGKITQDEEEKDSWSSVCLKFQRLERHLDLLKSETFKSLTTSSDSSLREYARQFSLSGGDESALEKLSQRVLEDLSSLDTLRSLLSVYPDEVAQIPEDIFMTVFSGTLESFRKGDGKSTKAESPEGRAEGKEEGSSKEKGQVPCSLKILSHLLKELQTYLQEGGELLQEDDILEELREFSFDKRNPLDTRIKVLSVAEQFLTLTERDKHQLQTMLTGGIVKAAFSSPLPSDRVLKGEDHQPVASSPSVKIFDDQAGSIDSEENRKELLDRLIQKMDSLKKANSIIELLGIWPPFSPQEYDSSSNPWSSIILKILDINCKETASESLSLASAVASKALQRGELPDDCIGDIVDKLLKLKASGGLLTAASVAFGSTSLSSQEAVIQNYKELQHIESDIHYNSELLDMIVSRKVVPRVLETTLFGPLFTYLNEEPNRTQREQAVEQLESTGHRLEAASLAVHSTSIPRSLKTASYVLQNFRKWL